MRTSAVAVALRMPYSGMLPLMKSFSSVFRGDAVRSGDAAIAKEDGGAAVVLQEDTATREVGAGEERRCGGGVEGPLYDLAE